MACKKHLKEKIFTLFKKRYKKSGELMEKGMMFLVHMQINAFPMSCFSALVKVEQGLNSVSFFFNAENDGDIT